MPFSRGSFRAERMWGGIDCTWYEVAGRTRTRGFVVRPSLEIKLSTATQAERPAIRLKAAILAAVKSLRQP